MNMAERIGRRVLGPVLALAVGCSTVFEARESQRALVSKGEDAACDAASSPVDFRRASLEGLVAFALTNRPSVVSKTLAVRDARLALKALAADAPVVSDTPWTAPKLAVSGGHSEAGTAARLDDGDLWRTEGNASAALSLELLVYDFGRNAAQARAQAERVVAAELALADERFTVFQAVAEGYFDFWERRALLAVAQTNAQQYAVHLAQAEARREAGAANRLDVLKARLDLAQAEQDVVAASNRVETTGATLLQALGVDARRGTWQTAFGVESAGLDALRQALAATEEDVGASFAFARANAPTLRVSRAKLRAASHDVDAAIADLYPSVSATASLSWTDPLWAFRWGLSASQSLFQGFRKTTAIDRSVVALERAAADVDEAEQTLSVELETAIANRDNAREALASARASMRRAAENLATVREQFVVGSASRVELSEAIAADSQARGDGIAAFYDGQRAEAALLARTGRRPLYREAVVSADGPTP